MECGIAVVSGDVRPVSELVDKGRTGLIFRRGDVEDLASKFRYFLDHPVKLREMGQRGRKRFSTKFSTERTIAKCRRIYEQAMRK
jgi:glycosyltransferase involved in cell wall biosynthesis